MRDAINELGVLPQWVAWTYVGTTKLLINPATGKAADSTDSATWGTIDQARQRATRRGMAGIGFVFTAEDPYIGIDLDDCIDPAGTVAPWAQAIIDAIATYTEISPSGTGVKLWARGMLPSSAKTKTIEMYTEARYFTFTGQHLPGTPTTINDATHAALNLYHRLKPPTPARATTSATRMACADDSAIQAWVTRIWNYCIDRVATAPDGHKHHTRFAMGRLMGGLVAHGLVTASAAEDALYNASPPAAGDQRERKTIADGILQGTSEPLPLPAPPPQPLMLDAVACCPVHTAQLRAGNTSGFYCSQRDATTPTGYCSFWWKGDGYTIPTRGMTTIDDKLGHIT